MEGTLLPFRFRDATLEVAEGENVWDHLVGSFYSMETAAARMSTHSERIEAMVQNSEIAANMTSDEVIIFPTKQFEENTEGELTVKVSVVEALGVINDLRGELDDLFDIMDEDEGSLGDYISDWTISVILFAEDPATGRTLVDDLESADSGLQTKAWLRVKTLDGIVPRLRAFVAEQSPGSTE